jgi:DNA-binding MarR family transcriptional regulator
MSGAERGSSRRPVPSSCADLVDWRERAAAAIQQQERRIVSQQIPVAGFRIMGSGGKRVRDEADEISKAKHLMPLTRETVELLVQVARAWYFEGDQHGLSHREWMALRFLSRANRFSQTPSALAHFIGVTKASATQIVKTLEEKSYIVRKTSSKDKRSIMLCVTSQGKKWVEQHDPINHVLNAVASLEADECIRLRDSLRGIVNHLDAAHHHAGICRDCIFLAEHGLNPAKRRGTADLVCRLYRAPLSRDEIELLCTNFEPARDRPKIDDPPRTGR